MSTTPPGAIPAADLISVPAPASRTDHLREILTGAAGAFTMRAFGAASGVAFYVVLARILGAEEMGIYVLALTITTIGTVVARVGMDNVVLRFVAAGVAEEDWSAVKGVHRRAMQVSLGISAVVTLVLVVAAPWIAGGIFKKPELAAPLRVMAVAVGPMAVALLQGEALKGLKRIAASQFTQWATLPTILLALGWVFLSRWGAFGGAVVYLFGSLVTMLVGTILWRRATPYLREVAPRFERSRLVESSTPLFWVASLNMVMTWIALVVLGVTGSSSDVGIFGMASRLSIVVGFVCVAVNSIASPKLAALHATGKKDELRDVVTQSSWIMLALAAPILAVILTQSAWIASLFGEDFLRGADALRILGLGQAALVVTGPATPLLMMSGREREVRNAIACSAVLAVVLNLVLVPEYGVNGAAIATAITLPLVNIMAAFFVWRSMGLLTVVHLVRRRGRAS